MTMFFISVTKEIIYKHLWWTTNGLIFHRASEDGKEQKLESEEEEDVVTIIDEAPNAIAFFCKLLKSVLNIETELTHTRHQTPNSSEHHNTHTGKTSDTLLTIINTKDIIVLFCEYVILLCHSGTFNLAF